MGKGLNRLSARSVTTATEPGYYADGGGLYMQVSRGKTKSWIYRYTVAGKTTDMGLGSVDVVSLSEARQAAAECRRQRQQGRDPLASRKAAMAAEAGIPAFAAATHTYIEDNRAAWANPKHVAQWLSTLTTYAFPVIGGKRVDVVNTQDALAILRPIWTTKPETASRVRQRCETILDAETAKGHRQGENPFRWRGHLAKLLPRAAAVRRVQHFPALPYIQLPEFMDELGVRSETAARALEVTILAVARTGMTCGAKWAEFDDEVWRVPAQRMKSKRPHEIPLSGPLKAILAALPRDGDYVFPGERQPHMSNGAMLQLLERMGYGHITVHGFRSTFKDWAAEKTDTPNEVSEAVLAHVIADKTEAAYRRGSLIEKRRALMEMWGAYCVSA